MSSRKPPSKPDDWDDFDIPTWDDSARSAPSRDHRSSSPQRKPSGRSETYSDPLYNDFEPRDQTPRPSGRSTSSGEQPPRLSSRVPTRTTRPSRQDPYRDPYTDIGDDLGAGPYYPSTPARDYPPQRPAAASQYDLYADPALDMDWEEAAQYEQTPPARRPRRGERAARPAIAIPRPAISDSTIASVVGAAILSLLIMIGTVWYGLGNTPSIIPWHLDAAGNVDTWVTNGTLWRIPFGSLMALVTGLVIGSFLWKRDRFAARFMIVSMCLIQVLAWVAVIDQLW